MGVRVCVEEAARVCVEGEGGGGSIIRYSLMSPNCMCGGGWGVKRVVTGEGQGGGVEGEVWRGGVAREDRGGKVWGYAS